MRIPPWLFVFGMVVFVGVTGIAAVLSFAVARQIAIDTASILDTSAIDFSAPLPTTTPVIVPTQVVVAGSTPLPATPIPEPLHLTHSPICPPGRIPAASISC